MSEGYTLEDRRGIVAGIVVRQRGEREFRFFSSSTAYGSLDGKMFGSAAAAQRAVRAFASAPKRA